MGNFSLVQIILKLTERFVFEYFEISSFFEQFLQKQFFETGIKSRMMNQNILIMLFINPLFVKRFQDRLIVIYQESENKLRKVINIFLERNENSQINNNKRILILNVNLQIIRF
ncbi:unnamed protein product [Paramecium sonneborni]|uniref:Uncharacterized protein n=1 Tax=Paramecium sonneborni TaxID=65129 RepID=A0A8S1RRT8_9CILI|nr:unnamed protein product [Paramecium sonneborni]